MPTIIVLDDLSEDGLDLLRSAGNIEVVIRTGLKGEELRKALLEADGAICRSGVKITAEALAGNHRLRAIARAGVGVDNIDTQAATRQGIVVMNTPGGNTISTAEHTLALMLGLSRTSPPPTKAWSRSVGTARTSWAANWPARRWGSSGWGAIGHAVAIRALAMEMRVIAYDPFLSAARAKEMGIQTVANAREMLPLVDYLTVHTPLNDETAQPDRDEGSGDAEEGRPVDQLRPRRNLRRGRPWPRAFAADRSAAWPWTCTPPSRAPTARCSACPTSSARRTWGPAPKRPKPTWPSRPPNC